ncbi:hypothetical protein GG344DRAFT_85038 [Lentinula edodes]|nr:hypothetical protein GG344DRAFT_85038 [Lentinula edodes]
MKPTTGSVSVSSTTGSDSASVTSSTGSASILSSTGSASVTVNSTSIPASVSPSSFSVSGSTTVSLSASSTVTISFPSGSVSSTATVNGTTTVVSTSVTTALTVVSVPSDLSFVLTQTTLEVASVSSSATSQTLSNPDQATTTFPQTTLSASAPLATAALPSSLPYRILPQDQLASNEDLSGYTLVSLLFDLQLNWPFVVSSPDSSSQLFAYMPVILQNSLGLTADQVKTWTLQVNIPSDYTGPSDADLLETMYLVYIPSSSVSSLQDQIKAQQSAFYTGVDNSVAQQLASLVNSGWNLLSIAAPDDSGSTGSSSSDSDTGASSSDNKSKEDAIIGVTASLGGIAICVLGFLIYRSYKRRKELAHRRLSEPTGTAGYRPEGREFDQDSVGGQRRRSFYFAEDSLRGYQGDRVDDSHFDARTGQMSQRRNVMPAAISAPILRESSMNW